jgi:hypothetical protein
MNGILAWVGARIAEVSERAIERHPKVEVRRGFDGRDWRPIARTLLVAIAIVAVIFSYYRWTLDARAFFVADDWRWLWLAEFFPFAPDGGGNSYTILPAFIYNDRPVGATWIWLMYVLFGLNHKAFQLVMLGLHAVNCLLLYGVARRYTRWLGALVAALAASVWYSADTAVIWLAAIFDVLGATLCLSTLLFRQLAIRSRHGMAYDIAGATCYFLAIRTKEFALGTVLLLFLMNVLVEKQSIRTTCRQLLPYLIVFTVCGVSYARLLAAVAPVQGDPYQLFFSPSDAIANLNFYISALFYADSSAKSLLVCGLIAALGIGFLLSDDHQKRVGLLGLAGFLIMLGPTLLLSAHRDPLYLYAPHFFMALAIGALFVVPKIPAVVAITAFVVAVVPPLWDHSRDNTINFILAKGEWNQAQLSSAAALLTPLPLHATVAISNVEPFFNPFSAGPGRSLQIIFKDSTMTVILEKPEGELRDTFCAAGGPKRFIRFSGAKALDVTSEVQKACDRT